MLQTLFDPSTNSAAVPKTVHQYVDLEHTDLVLITRQRGLFENANSIGLLEKNRDLERTRESYIVSTIGQQLTSYRWSALYPAVDIFGANLRQATWQVNRSRAIMWWPTTYFSAAVAEGDHEGWLEYALHDLSSCLDDAIEAELEEPSELGLKKATGLLREIAKNIDDRPDIYPMDEGSVAIDFRKPETKSGVLFLIEKDGSGALFYRTERLKGRIRVDDASDLLNESRLLEIKRMGIR